jgi:hypothetical protein
LEVECSMFVLRIGITLEVELFRQPRCGLYRESGLTSCNSQATMV